MKNIEEINKANVKKILTKKKIPAFFAGDTVKIGVRIVEGKSTLWDLARPENLPVQATNTGRLPVVANIFSRRAVTAFLEMMTSAPLARCV